MNRDLEDKLSIILISVLAGLFMFFALTYPQVDSRVDNEFLKTYILEDGTVEECARVLGGVCGMTVSDCKSGNSYSCATNVKFGYN